MNKSKLPKVPEYIKDLIHLEVLDLITNDEADIIDGWINESEDRWLAYEKELEFQREQVRKLQVLMMLEIDEMIFVGSIYLN